MKWHIAYESQAPRQYPTFEASSEVLSALALIHCALMFFFADLLAAIWPAFEHVWGGTAHLGVAVAALAATCAEYVHDEAKPHESTA